MVSHVHLKLKYHNMHDEQATINVDISEAKRIYKALENNHKEYEAMSIEIHVVSSIEKLKDMVIHSPTS